jgi:hypothetical protein
MRVAHAHSACAARSHAGARPTATRARPALAGPAARRVRAVALPGGARLGGGAARRAGGGSAPTHGRQRGRRLTGAETAMATGDDGRVTATGDAVRSGMASARQLSGRRRRVRGGGRDTARGARRRSASGRGEATVGTAARCPDSGFKPLRRRGARRLTGQAHSSAISELKFTRRKLPQIK